MTRVISIIILEQKIFVLFLLLVQHSKNRPLPPSPLHNNWIKYCKMAYNHLSLDTRHNKVLQSFFTVQSFTQIPENSCLFSLQANTGFYNGENVTWNIKNWRRKIILQGHLPPTATQNIMKTENQEYEIKSKKKREKGRIYSSNLLILH